MGRKDRIFNLWYFENAVMGQGKFTDIFKLNNILYNF